MIDKEDILKQLSEERASRIAAEETLLCECKDRNELLRSIGEALLGCGGNSLSTLLEAARMLRAELDVLRELKQKEASSPNLCSVVNNILAIKRGYVRELSSRMGVKNDDDLNEIQAKFNDEIGKTARMLKMLNGDEREIAGKFLNYVVSLIKGDDE